jgi:ribosomal protein S18 acetylase RimI-like enzyme
VAKEWLSRGVGAALMRACISQAQQKGFQSIWLGVWQRNERAYAFYRKWGFQVVGEHVFQLGSDPQNDWIVERAL